MTLRNSWFDGQQVSDIDLNIEQNAWFTDIANSVNISVGSGVEKEFAVQRLLFDSDDVPPSIEILINPPTPLLPGFDGTPIYQYDEDDLQVFEQPSDNSEGNQLEIILSGANLIGSFTVKFYIFGKIFGGTFAYEVLTFSQNESQTTKHYFSEITAIMTQDFMGNQNSEITGTPCRRAGGRFRIFETVPMTTVRDEIMIEQAQEPNLNFVDFKPSNISYTLNQVLTQIATKANTDLDSLEINVTATGSRILPPNSSGIIIAEKFQAATNNIQKISTLLSVQNDSIYGYDWRGSIVLGVRKLQTTSACPTDIVPGTQIEFDPQPVPLVEMSFTKEQLYDLGIILTDVPKVVDFIFATSLLANPSVSSQVEIGAFYAITIKRSGDTSIGTIVLPEASNITVDSEKMRLSVFSQNAWTDVPGSNLWFKVYTSAVRITDGTAYDNGIQIVSPKIKINPDTGIEEPYIEEHLSLLNTSYTTDNFVIVQAVNNYQDSVPHPATGNPVFTRIEDIPEVSIVSEDSLSTLIEAGNSTIILGDAKDTNHVATSTLSTNGITMFPGMLGTNTFTIINPPGEVLSNNLVGSILVPDIIHAAGLKYRIINVEVYNDAYGDVNGDGIINSYDVTLALQLDGYSTNTFPDDQLSAIIDGYIPMSNIIRAHVSDDPVITSNDATKISQYINGVPGTFPVGTTFKRMVITTENIFDPGTTTVNMIGENPSFNEVVSEKFNPIEFQVKFVQVWKPENIEITDTRRYISRAFTSLSTDEISGSTKTGGHNTSFIPGNLLIGGKLENVDGTAYSIDMEIGTIVLELPDGYTIGEVNIFDSFIKDKMKFYDGTYVETGALENNQVRVSVGVQSITKNYGNFVDLPAGIDYSEIGQAISLLYIQSSGLLRIKTGNIVNVATHPELRTKIVLTVYLKKAGFLNEEQTISSEELTAWLV